MKTAFLRVTDRLSRFSKIGGEMVAATSRSRKRCRKLAAASEQMFVVTAVPD